MKGKSSMREKRGFIKKTMYSAGIL